MTRQIFVLAFIHISSVSSTSKSQFIGDLMFLGLGRDISVGINVLFMTASGLFVLKQSEARILRIYDGPGSSFQNRNLYNVFQSNAFSHAAATR